MYYELNKENAMDVLRQAMSERGTTVICGTPDATLVLKGRGEFNEEYTTANNIKVIQGINIGNPIILFEGDVEYGLFIDNGGNGTMQYLLDKSIEFLRDKGLDATLDNNDILVDGTYKVCGCALTLLPNNRVYYALHFSINIDMDVIKNICKKKMVKIPKGLSDYGITTAEVRDFIINLVEG